MGTMSDTVRLLHVGLSCPRLRDADLRHGTEQLTYFGSDRTNASVRTDGARWMFRTLTEIIDALPQ